MEGKLYDVLRAQDRKESVEHAAERYVAYARRLAGWYPGESRERCATISALCFAGNHNARRKGKRFAEMRAVILAQF